MKNKRIGALVQLVRIHACHAWGHGFESRTYRQNIYSQINTYFVLWCLIVNYRLSFCMVLSTSGLGRHSFKVVSRNTSRVRIPSALLRFDKMGLGFIFLSTILFHNFIMLFFPSPISFIIETNKGLARVWLLMRRKLGWAGGLSESPFLPDSDHSYKLHKYKTIYEEVRKFNSKTIWII